MYYGRFKNSHYETCYHWGNMLYRNGKNITKYPTFAITRERERFAEKCQTAAEVMEHLNVLPIASQQTLTIIDSIGNFAVIKCNCRHVELIQGTEHDGFVVAANTFVSPK